MSRVAWQQFIVAEHMGLIEMLSIFGIGIALVAFELVSTSRQIRRDRKPANPASRSHGEDDAGGQA